MVCLYAGGVRSETGSIDLLGTWYVVVNYRAEDPERAGVEMWNDKVWHFEKKGSRLQWTEYSIVVFDEAGGRFEKLPSGRDSRVEQAWQPSSQQLLEIERGLQVNPRDIKAKTLRGTAERGYRSTGGIRHESTSVIGFSESWEIEGLTALPVFLRSAVMESGRTEGLEGITRYRVKAILRDGRELQGDYERDGVEFGSFRMLRAGPVSILGQKTSKRGESSLR